MAERVEVAIIGAGVHGVSVAAKLLERNPSLSIALIDPKECCSNWRQTTFQMGMTHLRSPWTHYVAGSGDELRRFAIDHRDRSEPSETPSLELFNSYTEENVIYRYNLETKRIPGTVTAVEQSRYGYTLSIDGDSSVPEEIRAENVVVAPGLGKPNIPDIIKGTENPFVVHSGEVNVHETKWEELDRTVLIVGGGLTAATLAVALAQKGASVTFTTKSPLQFQRFDFNPEWFGGTKYERFLRIGNSTARLEYLLQDEVHGSITPRLQEHMQQLARQFRLNYLGTQKISKLTTNRNLVHVETDQRSLGEYNHVILATGYQANIDNLEFLAPLRDKITQRNGLPVLEDYSLGTMGARGLFFSGALAKLGIGHAAPNVWGAYKAASFIGSSLA